MGAFSLKHGQSITIKDLPKGLGVTVTENLEPAERDYFRSHVQVNDKESVIVSAGVEPEGAGTVGKYTEEEDAGEEDDEEEKPLRIAFTNERYIIVCKIVNDNDDRDQLYYEDNGVSKPAIFETLEEAFALISRGAILRTEHGSTAEVALRVEMVVPSYTMAETASLSSGKTVTLSTALLTDSKYPYQGNPGEAATVTRGFNGGSMIENRGSLTLDSILLDGGSEDEETNTVAGKGGIVRVAGSNASLTVNSGATLRNSVMDTEGVGGLAGRRRDARYEWRH